jgi:16S rRNA (adenine1518-N6/adenine1519-N6)-dimethyltransferase
VRDEALFARVVRAAFGQRRKMLRNALAGLGAGVADAAAEAAIDLERRAETLSVEDFGRLSDALATAGAGRS